jgi:hypothetical protein
MTDITPALAFGYAFMTALGWGLGRALSAIIQGVALGTMASFMRPGGNDGQG